MTIRLLAHDLLQASGTARHPQRPSSYRLIDDIHASIGVMPALA
jgi:hypothetical protein